MKLFRIFILAVFTISLIACGGAEERKAVYMEKAKASIEAGDLDKARIELKNVLQIDPKDAEAYYQMGMVFEKRQEFRKAFANYKKAEELDPELLSNNARLGRIYLLLANDVEKAQEKIDYILSKDPENIEGLLLKAAMLLKNNKAKDALKMARDIFSSNPGSVDGAAFLATLYVNNNQKKDAIAVLKQALIENADNNHLNKLLALILVKTGDYDGAEKIYKNFLEKDSDNLANYTNFASFYMLSDNEIKAEEILRLAIENDPSDVKRQLILVKFIKETKGDKTAINELKLLIEQHDGFGSLRTALAELLYLTGNKQAAIDVYTKAIADFSEENTGVQARTALAAIYISEKRFEDAGRVIDESMSVSPNDPKLNFLKGKLAIRDNDFETAIIAFRIVNKEEPENIDASLLLAEIFKREKNNEQVKAVLNSAYENNRSRPDALLKLAKYYMKYDLEQADKIINSYNEIKENEYEGLSIKAALLNQGKQFSEALSLVKKLIELFPDKSNGYIQSVPYFSQKNDLKKAIAVLEEGYARVDDNKEILLLLTRLQVASKQFSIAEKRLINEISKGSSNLEMKVLLSKVYIADKKYDEAIKLLKGVTKDYPGVAEPYLLLAQAYAVKGETGLQEEVLISGRHNVANNEKLSLVLAIAYERNKKYSDSIRIYRELNEKLPGNMVITNNLVALISDHSEVAEDLQFALMLSEKLIASEQALFFDTVGWVHYKTGDYESAIKYLLKAVEKYSDSNIFSYHLGMAYKASGDKELAKKYLEKSLADNKPFNQQELAKAALKDL